jgi:hypothetical protein
MMTDPLFFAMVSKAAFPTVSVATLDKAILMRSSKPPEDATTMPWLVYAVVTSGVPEEGLSQPPRHNPMMTRFLMVPIGIRPS